MPTVLCAAERGRTPCQGRRVLLVEDHDDNRDSLGLLLRLWGCEVGAAGDGRQGLEAARTWEPEVAILDIGLPGMDGFELARRLREALGQDVKLIALTAYGDAESRRHGREAGFDHYLVKPAYLDKLAELLAA